MANYSLSQVAKQLNCNESTIHRAVQKNKLKIKKVGNKRRFTLGNIAKLRTLIRNREVIKDSEKTQSNASGSNDNLKDDRYINSLENQITDLKKDKENLTRLLENQQILTKQAQDKILLLASPEVPKKKESLLHRIFNKKIF